MKRNSLKICSRCISRDRKKGPNEPYFFSAANNLDFGEVPSDLPDLTMVEEMLIARVHVHVKVLQRHHRGYRDIVVPKGPVEEAVEEDPSDADASAIPNLQVTDTELNALQSRFLDGSPPDAAAFSSQDPHRRIQPFPAAANACIPYPDGKADFVEPRLRSITFQDYLAHAMRWHDGRFARHKTWPFVALNTLLQEAMAEPDEPEAQVLIQSITRQAAVIRAPGRIGGADGSIRQLLRDNAHIAAYHFHKRYALFRAIVLKQKFNLTDSWGRYEWGERNDGQINHYNRLLTVAWLANTDVSPCTSLQQVIDYAAKYCSKSEKKSESFAQIGKALMPRVKDHNPLISFTSKLLNQLVAERDYSKQEVSHLLLGLPLQEGSRTCLDPSKWKQWQPGNINGRPRVLVYFPRYQADPEGQQWSDYCREDLDLLGRRDIDINYDWTQHVGTYPELRDGYWKDLIASHPMANDVEVLGPHWRNTLNTQQRLVYDTFMGHFQAQNPAQILLHVDGGGGTAALPNPSPICRVAPTGVASNQIQGSTIHSLLRLPVGGTFTDLPPADAAALQSRLRHIKYLVIDEKSMLGLEQLARIDSRLRQAFPQRNLEFFGGVSVVLVGDFFQLPPVRQKPLYSTSTGLSSLERRGQVAYRLFDRTVFLTTAQRQAGDDQAQFRQALQELRDVKLSIPSWNLLSNRARVNQYNHEHMVHLNAPAIQVEAKNHGNGAGQAPSNNAGNLSNKFPVAKGTRVMLTTNLWQSAGLVNGAQGKSHPILPVRRDFLVGNETCARTQFPLIVAFAITVHKCQSLTKDKIVTDLATRDFQAGISYVAVSRVTSLQGLLLEAPFDRQSLYNHTPTEGMKMRLADQQRRQGQQLSDPLYPPLYRD
ncbi:PIF1-like helicase domain-containing protein [Hirsutella rhossiliensis]|uniref:ATP-dependent DNA helicase n=1 Tax=Hirsutella rhossiliensis TaxID=111463 RepID=A0A9P8SF94_9HYPO|nr:PIF1-like helicase domain-containing protein [Hirsutella rhossiliensis]KAH0958791.1 PIF1-like helicase domain-containing protein [Hirsutella rhossiliensis]